MYMLGNRALHVQDLKLDFATGNVPPHVVVANEAVKRLLECSGLVLLDEEVTDPRQAITCDEAGGDESKIAGDCGGCEQ